MELLFAASLGILVACGVYLLLRAHTFPVVVGLTLLSYAVNLFLFAMGRLGGQAPIIGGGSDQVFTDPVPQALVLTAIVIGFAMTAFVLALALRGFGQLGHDRVENPTSEHRPADVGDCAREPAPTRSGGQP